MWLLNLCSCKGFMRVQKELHTSLWLCHQFQRTCDICLTSEILISIKPADFLFHWEHHSICKADIACAKCIASCPLDSNCANLGQHSPVITQLWQGSPILHPSTTWCMQFVHVWALEDCWDTETQFKHHCWCCKTHFRANTLSVCGMSIRHTLMNNDGGPWYTRLLTDPELRSN